MARAGAVGSKARLGAALAPARIAAMPFSTTRVQAAASSAGIGGAFGELPDAVVGHASAPKGVQASSRGQRLEDAVDHRVGYAFGRRRVPARRIVLVDQQGADALDEVRMAEHAHDDAIFQPHLVEEVELPRAFDEQAERDLAGGGRFGAEGRQLLLRPVGAVRLQRGEDVLQPVRGEAAVDDRIIADDPGRRRLDAGGAQDRLDMLGDLDQLALHLLQPVRGDIMGGEAERDALRAVEPRAGQRQELRDAPAQAREVAAAADVGEQADRGLRHGEDGPLGRDPIFAGAGDADAAAHRDPVHEHDPALGVSVHEVVHPIFLEEEGLARRAMALARSGDGDDVAAGAEAAALGMVDQDQLHRRIVRASPAARGSSRAPCRDRAR